MRLSLALAAIASTLVPGIAVQAAELVAVEQTAVPEIVVTAAERQPTPLSGTTATVAVIDADEAHDRGHPADPVDWLRPIAGVDVRQAGPYGGVGGIRIRGAASYDTQILLDGIPLNDPSLGQADVDIAFLNPAGLERMEVVKGAQSGLYGSRAAGGVVNLVTLRPSERHAGSGLVEAGSYDTQRVEAAATGPLGGGFGYAVAASGLRSAGITSETDPGANGDPNGHEADGFARAGGQARVEWRRGPGMLYGAFNLLDGESEFDDTDANYTSQPDDPRGVVEHRTWRASGGGEVALAPDLEVALDAAHTDVLRAYPNALVKAFNVDSRRYDATEDYLAGRATWSVLPVLALTAGADGRRSAGRIVDATDVTVIDDSERIVGGYAQVQAGIAGAFEVTGALRRDEHSRAGGSTTWRAGSAVFVLDGASRLHASYGTAFRAPSLYELYDPSVGNADLRAQESSTWDLGQRTALSEWLAVETVLFRTEYDEAIGFDNATFRFANVGAGGTATGLESGVDLLPAEGPLSFRVAHTWQRARRANGDEEPVIPQHKLYAASTARIARWWGRLDVEHIGERLEFDGAIFALRPVEPVTLVGLALGRPLCRHAEAYLRVENLGGAAYEVQPGYATAGRTAYAGLSATF
jgi:vitamin B12 transporter